MQAANPPISASQVQDQLTTHLPLMWFSLAFLAGIVLASLVSLPLWVWVALSIISLLLALSIRFFPRLEQLGATLATPFSQSLSFLLRPFSFILLVALFLGAARYQLSVPNFDAFHIAFYNDRDYELLITGTLIEPPRLPRQLHKPARRRESCGYRGWRPLCQRHYPGACLQQSNLSLWGEYTTTRKITDAARE